MKYELGLEVPMYDEIHVIEARAEHLNGDDKYYLVDGWWTETAVGYFLEDKIE